MSRPLLITDCDEVLLHMVGHFAEWLEEAHDYHFTLETSDFATAIRHKASGDLVPSERIWPLLDGFFDTEMHRQKVVPGAVDALAEIARVAAVVILTNLGDEYQIGRMEQLGAVGIRHRVLCNRGGKGPAVQRVLDEMQPSVAVFVDDLPMHHESVAGHAPHVWRLHMIAEPRLAPHVPAAPHAHARIDVWDEASRWILSRMGDGHAPG